MKNIQLSKINLKAPTQLRLLENSQHIEELAYAYAEKGKFLELPWVALVKETNEFVPIDGFHRLMAVEWLRDSDMQTESNTEVVEIRYSEFDTMAEAIIAAAGVNATHGLKRQYGDVGNAIRTILDIDRIRFMESKFKLNKAAIMAAVNCSTRTYERETKEIRAEIEVERNLAVKKLAEQGFSQREISQRTDVPQKTVSRILSESKAQLAEMTHTKITTSEPSTASDSSGKSKLSQNGYSESHRWTYPDTPPTWETVTDEQLIHFFSTMPERQRNLVKDILTKEYEKRQIEA